MKEFWNYKRLNSIEWKKQLDDDCVGEGAAYETQEIEYKCKGESILSNVI